ncbi:MAG TPA: DUF3142 domain-containing protein [Pyrinomonadaceae bacterium]|nr:DUF3142 domain-containing protein [Pyrinomonadaceae bacterium]
MKLSVIFFLLPSLIAALSSHRTTPVESLPPVILWAWERPEDLSFIDPRETGVAYLAKTITLRGDKVVVRPRLQPLRLAPGTKVVTVVRIESDRKEIPSLSASQLQQTVREIRNSSASSVVQIDFDATVSERSFYVDLLKAVRRELPSSVSLSITALASWCAGDNWLHDLPIDEAVPMLFRLGVDEPRFQRRLETGQPFEPRMCRNAAGVSTDEPVKPPAVARLYLFHPKPWSKDSLTTAMEAYRK